MSAHDESLLQDRLHVLCRRNRQLLQALKDVCAIVEAIPEKDRVRLGLYSMQAFNVAYDLISKQEARPVVHLHRGNTTAR